jgi:flagellar biosynthesis GTPase FlhF
MPSRFFIRTNIVVPEKIAYLFNEKFDPYRYNDDDIWDEMDRRDIEVSAYFDNIDEDEVETLDMFLNKSSEQEKHGWYLQAKICNHSWEFENNALYSCLEKSHGAVSVIHFFIERFFKNHNVLLNGTIIGVNGTYPMGYVYNVKNNIISLDKDATLEIIHSLDGKDKSDREKYTDEFFNEYVQNHNEHNQKEHNEEQHNQEEHNEEHQEEQHKQHSEEHNEEHNEEQHKQHSEEQHNVVAEHIEHIEESIRRREESIRQREEAFRQRQIELKKRQIALKEKEMDKKEKEMTRLEEEMTRLEEMYENV